MRVDRLHVGMTVATACVLVALLAAPVSTRAHGAAERQYRSVITDVEPDGLPIDVRMKGDQLRVENVGDEELAVCGYTPRCEPWLRIGPDGVFEDRNSGAWHANLEEDEFGDVPPGVGEGPPEWALVRREPAFHAYHDHRAHWMGRALPPNVDETDPDPQKVTDWTVEFRYGDRPGAVHGRLEYVGGRSWFERYGETVLTGGAVAAMIVVFILDARRRRRSGSNSAAAATGPPAD